MVDECVQDRDRCSSCTDYFYRLVESPVVELLKPVDRKRRFVSAGIEWAGGECLVDRGFDGLQVFPSCGFWCRVCEGCW
jgi:hypothetical protein